MSLDGHENDRTRIDGGGCPDLGEPPVVTVLTVDGIEYSICADPTMASLKAIREIAEHVRPRRGCIEGICGKCESIVNGVKTRGCASRRSARSEELWWSPRNRERASGAENHKKPDRSGCDRTSSGNIGYNPIRWTGSRGRVSYSAPGRVHGNCTLVLVPPGAVSATGSRVATSLSRDDVHFGHRTNRRFDRLEAQPR